jgi:trimeric autotransporter adhesin
MSRPLAVLIAALPVLMSAASAEAQLLGTFRWQLQPFCNVVTANVTQQGAIYTVDGYDDQCGAAQRAPLVGLATPNPDGTIGFGLHVVTVPGGRSVHIDARITLAGLGGSWTDSLGNSGTFAFGASSGGSPRPAPPAPGGGGATIPPTFALLNDGGFLARGTFGTGVIPASNIGTRMMWHPRKAAFRAGQVTIPAWDDVNIGTHSTAFGLNTVASGIYSFAAGVDSAALGTASTAIGSNAQATANYSTALGTTAIASGSFSLATGAETTAGGYATTAMGLYAEATAAHAGSFVFGDASTNAVGTRVQPTGTNQFVARAAGGFYLFSSSLTSPVGNPGLPGVRLLSNASAWISVSDENAKENFRDIGPEDLLARIAAMPVREWNYKAQGADIRHMGPTAQDFRKAFGLGEDPLGISTIDADGVALAAVRALEARTRETNQRLTRENDELRSRLARLEARLDKQ